MDSNQWYLRSFFQGIDLQGKDVLDVGCGDGWCGRYALKRGARSVIGLEPGAAGHDKKVITRLGVAQSSILPFTIQDYKPQEKFDVIILHDSVNHLDEQACIELKRDMVSRTKYYGIFSHIHHLLNSGGKIVIADASRSNLFADLRVKNPFAPSIEWHKHQKPELWISLLLKCGFKNPKVTWLTPRQLSKFNWLISNKVVSYFIVSHFRLVMEKRNVD